MLNAISRLSSGKQTPKLCWPCPLKSQSVNDGTRKCPLLAQGSFLYCCPRYLDSSKGTLCHSSYLKASSSWLCTQISDRPQFKTLVSVKLFSLVCVKTTIHSWILVSNLCSQNCISNQSKYKKCCKITQNAKRPFFYCNFLSVLNNTMLYLCIYIFTYRIQATEEYIHYSQRHRKIWQWNWHRWTFVNFTFEYIQQKICWRERINTMFHRDVTVSSTLRQTVIHTSACTRALTHFYDSCLALRYVCRDSQ